MDSALVNDSISNQKLYRHLFCQNFVIMAFRAGGNGWAGLALPNNLLGNQRIGSPFLLSAQLHLLCLPTQIVVASASNSDGLVVNKDNASTGGLQAGPQRISVF